MVNGVLRLLFVAYVVATAVHIGIVVAHEPAEPVPAEGLFDRATDVADTEQLLQMTAALLESLRVAHAGEGGRSRTHGGLCPGVLVRDENGQIKVTDFGFAQAICSSRPGSQNFAAVRMAASALLERIISIK